MHLNVRLPLIQENRGNTIMTKLESLLHASTGLSLISGYLMYNRRYLPRLIRNAEVRQHNQLV